jgi:SAM-dependent methyltransferase
MYLAKSCPCCGSKRSHARPAIVAPFVAERALGRAPERCNLLECRTCGFRFFDLRLSDAEIGRLYADYRGEEYYLQRHRHEFWYSRKTNAHLGETCAIVEARCNTLRRFLENHLDTSTIDTVLDYGGDRGQVIPVGRRRFVFDLSRVASVDGVTSITSEEELGGMTFDLVMLCHVLEHASDPQALVARLRPLGKEGACFYFEVPLERPHLFGIVRGRLGEAWLDALRRVPPLLRAVDFYSTVARIRAGVLPPLGFVKMHEHLNFFTEGSLRALMDASRFEVAACETLAVPHAFGRVSVIACLARPR